MPIPLLSAARAPLRVALRCTVLAVILFNCTDADVPTAPPQPVTPTPPTAPAQKPDPAAVSHASAATLSGVVGTEVAARPSVRVTDARGVPVEGVNVSFAVTVGGGAVTGAAQTTGATGVATVGSWTLGTTAGENALVATVAGLPPVTFTAAAAHGPPARLEFIAAPGDVAAGTAMSPAVQVEVKDAHGNRATSAPVEVTLALAANPGSATLSGATTATAASGVATFTTVTLNRPGTGYTLVARAAGVEAATSGPFSVRAGDAARLEFVVGPSNVVAGNAMTPAVQLELRDAQGNRATGATHEVALELAANPGGATLAGTTSARAVEGLATFGGIALNRAAAGYTLVARAPGVEPATSGTFEVVAGAAAQIVLAVPPAESAENGVVFSRQPSVQLRDASGNPSTRSGVAVTAAIASGGGALHGATSASTDASGAASFTDLSITGTPGRRTLSFSTAGAPAITSPSIEVRAGRAAAVTVAAGNDQRATAGSAVPIAPAVRVADASGNPVAGVAVTFAVTRGGGRISGASATSNAEGIAAAASWTLGPTAGANALSATATGLPPVTFQSTGTPGPAATLAKHAGDGQTVPVATTVPVLPAVRVQDAHGNVVSGADVTFAVTSGGGAITGGNAKSNGSGIATVGSWTLGPLAGKNSLVANLRGVAGAQVTFAATATAVAAPPPPPPPPPSGPTPSGSIITGRVSLSGTQSLLSLSPSASSTLEQTISAAAPAARQNDELHAAMMDGSGAIPSVENGVRNPERLSQALIVTFRAATLDAPPVRSRAYAMAAIAGTIAGKMRSRLAAAVSEPGARIGGTSPAMLAARIRVAPEYADEIRARLLADPAVASVEPDFIVYAAGAPAAEEAPAALAATVVPNDPYYRGQAWHYGILDLPRAWSITTGSSSVLVAVLDDGIRFDHPGISANLTSDGYDFVTPHQVTVCGVTRDNAGDGDGYDRDPTIPVQYDCSTGGLSRVGGHGLHVAGTIGAAGNDGIGMTGVNWRVRIRPVRVLGITRGGSTYDVAQGILYAAGLPADNGAGGHVQASSAARIINLSIATSGNSTHLQNAVEAATAAGALIVASAGNDATSTPYYPAAYPQVLGVSAVAPDGRLAPYSNYGSWVGIAAPGGIAVQNDGSFGVGSTVWNFAEGKPGYGYFYGTSMAAPHVSGVAALLLARESSLSVEQLRRRLTDFARDAGPAGRDDQYGAGIVNARNSLTGSLEPYRERYAALYDAPTGRLVKTIRVGSDGTYTFAELGAGEFHVFAGEDEERDAAIGAPGRRWGAYGSAALRPGTIAVGSSGSHTAPVTIGRPSEIEPNDDQSTGGRLVLGGHAYGELSSTGDADLFTIALPEGRYTFETSGWIGACAFAYEADTKLELLRADGSQVAFSDDIAAGSFDHCSRVTVSLTAGSYVVRITGKRPGRYRLEVRSGG